MKRLLDRGYELFSKQLHAIFILSGICAFGLYAFISFMGSIILYPEEALSYTITLFVNAAIISGLIYGHYKGKDPVLLVSLLAYFVLFFNSRFTGAMWGLSYISKAPVTYVLMWIFFLLFALALGCLTVSLLLVYLFKIRKAKYFLEASYLVTLGFGYLAWIFGIVFAASGGNWLDGVLPLLEVTSLLMLPGLLESILPGELDTVNKEIE